MWPFNNAQQERIDSLTFENAMMEEASKKLRADLDEARRQTVPAAVGAL